VPCHFEGGLDGVPVKTSLLHAYPNLSTERVWNLDALDLAHGGGINNQCGGLFILLGNQYQNWWENLSHCP